MWQINPKAHDEVWDSFLNEFQEYEKRFLLKEKEDEFLDLYSQWLKTHEEGLRDKLLRLVKEIYHIEPSLNFANLLRKLEKSEV